MQDGGMAPDYSILDRATMQMQQAAQMSAQAYGAIPLQQSYNQTMQDLSYTMAPPIPSMSMGGGGYSQAYLESIRLQRELSAQQMGASYQARAEQMAATRSNVGLVGNIAGFAAGSLISNPILSAAASIGIPLGVSAIAEGMGLYDAPPEVSITGFTLGNIAQSTHALAWNQLDPFTTGGLRGVSINAAKDMAETLYGAARQQGMQGMEVSRIMPALESVGGYSGVTNPDEIVNRTVQYIESIATFIKKTRASLDDAVAVIGSGLSMGAGTSGIENFMANISTYSSVSGMSMGNYINTVAQIASPLQGMAGDYSGIAGGFGELVANARTAQMYDPNPMADTYWAQAGGPAQVAANMANMGMAQFGGIAGARRAAAFSMADPGAFAQYMATGVMPSGITSDFNNANATDRYQAIYDSPGWLAANVNELAMPRMTQMFNAMPTNLRYSNNEEAQAGYLYAHYGIPTATGYGMVGTYNSYRQGYGFVSEEGVVGIQRNEAITEDIRQIENIFGRLGQASLLGVNVSAGRGSFRNGIFSSISSTEITGEAGLDENRFIGRSNVPTSASDILEDGAIVRVGDLLNTPIASRTRAEAMLSMLNESLFESGTELSRGSQYSYQRYSNERLNTSEYSANQTSGYVEYEFNKGAGFVLQDNGDRGYTIVPGSGMGVELLGQTPDAVFTIGGAIRSIESVQNSILNNLTVEVNSEQLGRYNQQLLESAPNQVMNRLFNTNPIAELYVAQRSRTDADFRNSVVGLIDVTSGFVGVNGLYRSGNRIPTGGALDAVARSTQVSEGLGELDVDGIMNQIDSSQIHNTSELMDELARQKYGESGVTGVSDLSVVHQQEIANMVGYGNVHGYWDTSQEGWTDVTYGDLTNSAEGTLEQIYNTQAQELGLSGGDSLRRIMESMTPTQRDEMLEYTFNGGPIPESLENVWAVATREGLNMNIQENREFLFSSTARTSAAIGIGAIYSSIGAETGLSESEFASRLLEGTLRVDPWTGEGDEPAESRLLRQYQRGGWTSEEAADFIARGASASLTGSTKAWEEPGVQPATPASLEQNITDMSADIRSIAETGLKVANVDEIAAAIKGVPASSGRTFSFMGMEILSTT